MSSSDPRHDPTSSVVGRPPDGYRTEPNAVAPPEPAPGRGAGLMGRVPTLSAAGRGPVWLAGGLVISAISAYGYLVLAGRVLRPQEYANMAVLWTMVNIVGIGLFNPIELEMSRAIAHRRGLGQGGLPLFVQAFRIVVLVLAATTVVMLVTAPLYLGRLYDGSWSLLLVTLLAVGSMALSFLSRGVFASVGRFSRYGMQLIVEGVLRVLLAVVVMVVGVRVVGVRSAGVFGVILVVALGAAVMVTFTGPKPYLADGPPAQTAELNRRLALLIGTSVLSYALVNSGPILVKLLAGPDQRRAAGVFLAGLQVARVPLFVFAAVSVVMLPRLAASYARRDLAGFRRFLSLVLLLVGGVGAAGVAASAAIGPWAVRTLFGPSFVFGRTDLALLALGSALYMFGLALAQALLAVESHAAGLWGWAAGMVGLAVATWVVPGLEVRVEWGFVVGSGVAVALMAFLLRIRLAEVARDRRPDPRTDRT